MTADSYTEVTRRSWGSKLGGSIKGVFGGLVMVAAGIGLLWWNEGRAVVTARSLREGARAVVTVDAGRVDPARNGQLVHLSGEATTGEVLADPICGVQATALALRRRVEMMQWKEDKRSETKKKLGGGDETVTTYTYSKTWSEQLIDSGSFRKPEGHGNPGAFPLGSETWRAREVTLGAFTLSAGLAGQMSSFEPMSPPDPYRVKLAAGPGRRLQVSGNHLYVASDPSNPQVGDLRLSFSQVRPGTVSVIAQQSSGSLVAYQTKAGRPIEMLRLGVQPADRMFEAAQKSNSILTWILRLAGFLVIFLGLKSFLNPLVALGDVVPFIGNLIGAGTGVVSFLGATVITTIIVALAWLAHRPLLAIGLLVVALVAVVLIVTRRRARPAADQRVGESGAR